MDEINSILNCRVRFRWKFQAYIIHSSQFAFKKGKHQILCQNKIHTQW